MDFRFTDEQKDLITAASDFFNGEHGAARMRDQLDGKPVPDLWPRFAELGLLGIMAPEEVGGLGQDFSVMAGIAEAAGYYGVDEFYVQTAGITVPLLMAMGEMDKLRAVVAGEIRIAPLAPLLYAQQAADTCAFFIRTSPTEHKLIPASDIIMEPLQSIDPLRQIFKLTYQGENKTKSEGDAISEHYGAVLTSAQLCGLAKRTLDMSVDYAKEREQFGKPIGAFQAIKHHLATVHTQIEFTRPTIWAAAILGAGGRMTHQAKIAAIDTGFLAAETAIQVHGGMGYTFEVSLHLFMKRIWALAGAWGDKNTHLNRLADMVLAEHADLTPASSFTH